MLSEASTCHTATLRVRFGSAAHASLAGAVLAVDAELQAGKAAKAFACEGPTLCIAMRATELRVLRVVVASMFDRLAVVARTLRDHAPAAGAGAGAGAGAADISPSR